MHLRAIFLEKLKHAWMAKGVSGNAGMLQRKNLKNIDKVGRLVHEIRGENAALGENFNF